MKPVKADAAIEGSERALFDFTAAYADGTLGDIDVTEASDLVRRASEDVNVAANAFGADAKGMTPEALRERMDGVYAEAFVSNSLRREQENAGRREAERFAGIRSDMAAVLGLTDSDVERMDFDAANGDRSGWLRAKERFVFG